MSFSCTTNKSYTMINKAIFVLPNGARISVDRNGTDYTNEISEDGKTRWLTMDWGGCYLWDINDCNIFCDEDGHGQYLLDDYGVNEFKRLIKDAYVEFKLEDDAPDEDYQVTIESFCIDGDKFENNVPEKIILQHDADIYTENLSAAVMDTDIGTYHVTEDLVDKYNSSSQEYRDAMDYVFSQLTGMDLKEFVED